VRRSAPESTHREKNDTKFSVHKFVLVVAVCSQILFFLLVFGREEST
jgi:hypothetical protein